MTVADKYKKAELWVMDHILSDWNDLTFDGVIDALENEEWDKVTPWYPFEDFDGCELSELMILWRENLVKIMEN